MMAGQGGEMDRSTEPPEAGLTGVASLDIEDEKDELVDVPMLENETVTNADGEHSERELHVQVVDGNHDHNKTQYRLTFQVKKKKSFLNSLIGCFMPSESEDKNLTFSDDLTKGFNHYIVAILKWNFKTSFLYLITSTILAYLIFTVVFALLIFWSISSKPKCVSPLLETRLSGSTFRDAWTLSWTTFSTVGYGIIAPATSGTFEDESGFEDNDYCFVITLLCSLESFMGILFAGFCGAIIFAKIGRIHSQAQIMFSSSLVVRHGRSLNKNDSSEDIHYFCPVLEFRIVNRLWNIFGGEIMDSSVNVVASLDSKYIDKDVIKAMDSNIAKKLQKAVTKQWSNTLYKVINSKKPQNTKSQINSRNIDATLQKHLESDLLGVGEDEAQGLHTFTEDSSNIVPSLIYTKLDVKPDKHPFFRRVWLVRHVLDQDSPLLKKSIRRSIKENNGQWPKEINTDEAVKNSFKFDQILVSFSGTSNVSASDVFAQKVYDFKDEDCVLVGQMFENVLYRTPDKRLSVDLSKINQTKQASRAMYKENLFGESSE